MADSGSDVSLPVVVMAYKRVKSLKRLLSSLLVAQYPIQVDLIFSIGRSRRDDTLDQLLSEFTWPFGGKKIEYHQTRLDISSHRDRIFDSSLTQYSGIVLLEDDIVVSPVFYVFALQALKFYENHQYIAGISLNSLWFNGYTHLPFQPVIDRGDCYFMQVPFYHGQVFSKSMMKRYLRWSQDSPERIAPDSGLHDMLIELSHHDDEWFPYWTKYLVETEQYFVFPFQSTTTGFGDKGKHFQHSTDFFQIAIRTGRSDLLFVPIEASASIYDSYQEITNIGLKKLFSQEDQPIYETFEEMGWDLVIDLSGTKSKNNVDSSYMITTRDCTNPIMTFGAKMRPMILNVVYNVEGEDIKVARVEDVDFTSSSEKSIKDLQRKFHRLDRFEPTKRETLISLFKRLIGK